MKTKTDTLKVPNLNQAEKEVERWRKEWSQILQQCKEVDNFTEIEEIEFQAKKLEEIGYEKSAINNMVNLET